MGVIKVFDDDKLVYQSGVSVPAPPPLPTGMIGWNRPDGSSITVPAPQSGEGIMGYAQRISKETGYPENAVGAFALGIGSTTPFGTGADPATWPKIIDYLADKRRYMTAVERAAFDALPAQWEAENAKLFVGSIDPDTVGVEDWVFYWKQGWHATRQYELFTKKPIMRDKDTGRLFQNPDEDFKFVDVSTYVQRGGLFAKYVLNGPK